MNFASVGRRLVGRTGSPGFVGALRSILSSSSTGGFETLRFAFQGDWVAKQQEGR